MTDGKFTKQEAGFRDRGIVYTCGALIPGMGCIFFQGLAKPVTKCGVVEGEIPAEATCLLWQKVARPSLRFILLNLRTGKNVTPFFAKG